MRAAHRTHPMGPLELEATVERPHSGAVAWKADAPDPEARRIARPIAEADLRWYFGDAAGELGLRGMSLEPTAGGGDGVAAAERTTAAYVRFTAVRRALLALSTDDRRVLSLAYTERRSPPNDPLAGWHERAGVAAWLIARTEAAAHGRTLSADDALHALAALATSPTGAVEAGLLRSRAGRRMGEALDRYRAAYVAPRGL